MLYQALLSGMAVVADAADRVIHRIYDGHVRLCRWTSERTWRIAHVGHRSWVLYRPNVHRLLLHRWMIPCGLLPR